MIMFLENLIASFIAIFVILTPFTSILAFIAMTKGVSKEEKYKEADIAVWVAFVILIIFLFFGDLILKLLGITINSFKVGGGIVLLILGINQVLKNNGYEKSKGKSSAGIIIGTPLLTGPGAITTIIILSSKYGKIIPLIASVIALSITWLLLRFSSEIEKKVSITTLEVSVKVVGLLITAIAVQFIIEGSIAIINSIG